MGWNEARREMVAQALQPHRLDAIVCAHPTNVLMLSGYWPIVGTAVAIAAADGTLILAPKDEQQLALRGYARRVIPFEAGSIEKLLTAVQGLEEPLADAMHS